MNRSAMFEAGLIVAAIATMLIAMFPLIRALSKVGLDHGYFLRHDVAPRVGIVAVVLGTAVILRARHPRWSWATLAAAPILVFGGDLLIMAL